MIILRTKIYGTVNTCSCLNSDLRYFFLQNITMAFRVLIDHVFLIDKPCIKYKAGPAHCVICTQIHKN